MPKGVYNRPVRGFFLERDAGTLTHENANRYQRHKAVSLLISSGDFELQSFLLLFPKGSRKITKVENVSGV